MKRKLRQPKRLVLAAHNWPTNGHLIADVALMGYLRREDHVLDPTWGRGKWWTQWKPNELVRHDKYTLDGVDFRDLPHPDDEFDVVAFDPPYVAGGGVKTSTIDEMRDRYGMDGGPQDEKDFESPEELQELIEAGLEECRRVVKPKGLILVKCKTYVSSGELWLGSYNTLEFALERELACIDWFEHIGKPGPQSQKRQVHARRNLSTLYVLRKPKPKKGKP